jgi:hypothetical protein
MTYLMGLALLVLGGGLLTGAMIGLVGIVMLISGAALIARAVERLEGVPVGPLRSRLGVEWRAAERPPVPWDESIWTGSACAVWPGVICAGAWLRRRPARPTLRFLWLSLAATYPAIYVAGLALSPYLPRSL